MTLVRYRVLNYCRIWSPTGLNIPHPLPAREKGELNQREVRGATVHKAGSKIPTLMIAYPVYEL
jgi:hypothetical protein